VRIGLIVPPWLPVPPTGYGGTEVVVGNLARGLRKLGHAVELFTVGESTCPVSRSYLYSAAVEPMGDALHEVAHDLAAYEALGDRVDIIHDHTTLGAFVAGRAGLVKVPVVVTNHGPFTMEARRLYAEITPWARIVAISRAQAGTAGSIAIAAVIHHGIDLEKYRLGPGGGGYLMSIGRMSPDKGLHVALEVAHRTGRPLKIVTRIQEGLERDYFAHQVEPLLGPDDRVLVDLSLAERIELLRHADALLNPIRWPEPFGLVMVEALACGVPVLTSPRGAAPEIVISGRTGFLCEDQADMTDAVHHLDDIGRAVCRADVERRFSLDRMAADHVRMYQQVLSGADMGGPASAALLSARRPSGERRTG
jgi:glycosyltransferase involved in cell wall biosynthesis